MSVYANRCGRFPPIVKTAVPVDGRFEHIVLSCNATSDHAIIWIEREAERALEVRLSVFLLPTVEALKAIYQMISNRSRCMAINIIAVYLSFFIKLFDPFDLKHITGCFSVSA